MSILGVGAATIKVIRDYRRGKEGYRESELMQAYGYARAAGADHETAWSQAVDLLAKIALLEAATDKDNEKRQEAENALLWTHEGE